MPRATPVAPPTMPVPSARAARARRASAVGVLPVLGALVLFASAARMPVLTPDVWWHLATGRYVAQAGIPHADPFSYTLAGKPWLAHEWLADRVLFAIDARAGLLGLVWLRAALLVAALAAAYRVSRLHAGTLLAAGILGLVAYASQRNWLDRPQLWSYLLAPLVVLVLERGRRAPGRTLYVLPVLFALWVNLHGAFMLGFVVVLAWSLAEAWSARRAGTARRARVWLAVAGLCALATLANPYGVRGALYPLHYVGSGLRQTIQEEHPGRLDSSYAWVHFGIWLLLGASLVARWRRTPAAHRAAALALLWLSAPRLGGIALPLAAERHAPLLLFAGAPLLAWQVAALGGARWGRIEERARVGMRAAPGWAAALALLAYTSWWAARALPRDPSPEARLLPGRFPEAAVAWLRHNALPGPLVNPYRWGGFLLFHLWPDQAVWIDSRGDLYGVERLREDELLYRMPAGSGRAVEALLRRYDANVVVWYFLTLDFGPLQLHPFTRWLLSRPDWRLVFVDPPDPRRPSAPSGTTAVFLRVHPRNAALLQRYPPIDLPPGLRR